MCFLYLVTSLVTRFEEFKCFENALCARWTEIVFLSLRLEIEAICKYDCENGRVYLVNKTVLAPYETSFTLTDLVPGSQCKFTLKAVFNPASIDKGISVTHRVLPSSKKSSHINV